VKSVLALINCTRNLTKTRRTLANMVFSWFSSGASSEGKPEEERGGYECAPYSILETHADYEVRSYPERKWATVVFEKVGAMGHNDRSMSMEQPQNKSFMKLFRYISGNNEPGAKISMTVPVSTKVTMDGETIREEMGFYVPSDHQQTTPDPGDKSAEVKIVTRPDMVAFVRRFGGFAKDTDWSTQRDALIKDLKTREDAEQIDFETYYRQGYDAPFKFWGRKNEVLIVKKTETPASE